MNLVTTFGGTSSNAYADLAYVNTYAEEKPFTGQDWTDESDDDKKMACIIQATKDIDSLNWFSVPLYTDQVLAFPRAVGWDSQREYNTVDGILSLKEYTRMLNCVKRACAEQALYIYSVGNERENVRLFDDGQAGKSETIGRLSESYNIVRAPQILCFEARAALKEYKGAIRLVRG